MQKPNKIKPLDINRYASILRSPGQVQALATRLNFPNPKNFRTAGDLFAALDRSTQPERRHLAEILRECIQNQYFHIKFLSGILSDMMIERDAIGGAMPFRPAAPLKGRGFVRFEYFGDPDCIPPKHITTLTRREGRGFRTDFVISKEVHDLFNSLYSQLAAYQKVYDGYRTPAEMALQVPQSVQLAGHGR